MYEEEDACHRSLFTIVAEPYRPVELIDIYIYNIIVYIIFYLKLIKKNLNAFDHGFFRWSERVLFFLYQLNVHTFNCRHRADRRVEGGFKVRPKVL